MQDLTKSLILVDLTLVESDATISGLPFCEGIVYGTADISGWRGRVMNIV